MSAMPSSTTATSSSAGIRAPEEIGDQPIFAADTLNQVFKEVKSASGNRRIPVQFMFSNAVHGAEGPIDKPHA
jgi:hypothetical protein